MYGKKIRFIREVRGLSQENVASKVGIAQNTYSKIETNQSKLETGILIKIAAALGVSPMDILSSQPAIVNLQADKETQQVPGRIEVLANQKELFERIIAAKDEEIKHLNAMIIHVLAEK